jgi:hypothetical protein
VGAHTPIFSFLIIASADFFLGEWLADLSLGHLTTLYQLLMLGFELDDRMLYRVNWEGSAHHLFVISRHLPGKTEKLQDSRGLSEI